MKLDSDERVLSPLGLIEVESAVEPSEVQSVEIRTDRLGALAVEIRTKTRGAQEAFASGALLALDAGRMLIEAKRLLKHGEWGCWLAEHTSVSDRMAQNYMKLAKAVDESNEQNWAKRVSEMSLSAALAELKKNPNSSSEPDSQNP